MKINRHEPIGSDERYVSTFGRSKKLDIDQNTILGVIDTETGNYTCLEELAGTRYEDQIFNALGRTEYGKNLDEANPVEDRYHSEEELQIIAEGLEPGDELVDRHGPEKAFEKLMEGHPENTDTTEANSSVVARKRMNYFN
jgi:hypothetical protein